MLSSIGTVVVARLPDIYCPQKIRELFVHLHHITAFVHCRFRRLVRSNRALYRSCPKHTKLLVAKAIVQAVQQQDPPGRFIKLKGESDTKESIWEPITYSQAVNKTSQALREKESRDGRNKKKQQEQKKNQNLLQESLQEINEKKKLEIANVAANPTEKERVKKTHKKGSDKLNPLQYVEPVGDRRHDLAQEIPPPLGLKRKISEIGNGNKRTKVLDGGGRRENTDSDRMGGHETEKMGRGVVKQVKTLSSMTETPLDASTPFPIETTLGPRQSTLFRFLNSTGLFGREAGSAQAQPTVLTSGSSQEFLQSTSWPQETAPTMMNNPEFRQDQRSSTLPFSSDQHMGMTSVQYLRSRNLPPTSTANSVAGLEEEMEDIATSGLEIRGDGEDHDAAAPLPPQKGLRSQMSDWLSSFFPPTKRDDELGESRNYNDNTDFGPSSHSGMENDGTAIPPPPGGEGGLGRSVSSAIFGLVESPSIFLSTLKSGVSSVFGEAATGETFSPTLRRFPSAFQQQQVRQLPNFLPQQQSDGNGGSAGDGDAIIGNHPVLGEPAPKRDSLLDDIDETPMEKELRNAKPEERTRGVRFFGKPSRYMPFK